MKLWKTPSLKAKLSIWHFPLKSKQDVWKYVFTNIHSRHVIPLTLNKKDLTADLQNLKLSKMNKTDIVGHIVNSIQFTPLNLKNSSLYNLVKNITMCNTDDLSSFWTWIWFNFYIFWTTRWLECINLFVSRPNVWKGIFSTKKTKWILPLKTKNMSKRLP